jgi:hypothetical protein
MKLKYFQKEAYSVLAWWTAEGNESKEALSAQMT